jgi:hypothetical protein
VIDVDVVGGDAGAAERVDLVVGKRSAASSSIPPWLLLLL